MTEFSAWRRATPLDLKAWERAYRKAAKADGYAVCRQHLARLELPDEPALLLEGTIHVVRANAAYHRLDGTSSADFLAMQTYDPAERPDAVFSYTFDLCGRAFARVLVSTLAVGPGLDLADTFAHPWDQFRVAGFDYVLVSRNDGRMMSRREMTKIRKEVTNDLRFDYGEDEVTFEFDDHEVAGVLRVDVRDV